MKILLRRVPKITDPKVQSRMMQGWYDIIVETYAPKDTVPTGYIKETKTVIEPGTIISPAKDRRKVK